MTMRTRCYNEMMSSEEARLEIGHKLGYDGFEKGGKLDTLYSKLLKATVKCQKFDYRNNQKARA